MFVFKKEFSFEDVCFIFDMMMETELKIALIDDAFTTTIAKTLRQKWQTLMLRNLKNVCLCL
ncbi:MAG: hypothetical protein IPP29_11420 [Bacteroidetes bacterium]|nr:hypothetical protein [Bacteroidota bacterium]